MRLDEVGKQHQHISIHLVRGMAWKRGVANNQAGEIRKGQIREFRQPSSQQAGLTCLLRILAPVDYASSLPTNNAYALLSREGLSAEQLRHVSSKGILYLHAHRHPASVIAAVLRDDLPPGTIVLTETQLVNSKVCIGEKQVFTIYDSNVFAYDCREGVIGNTEVRVDRDSEILGRVSFEIRLRNKEDSALAISLSTSRVVQNLKKSLYGVLVTVGDVYLIHEDNHQLVCRVQDLEPEVVEENDLEIVDHYRGLVDDHTVVTLSVCDAYNALVLDTPSLSNQVIRTISNVIVFRTKDDELFPVKRRLLRPCISLTSVVQAGKGKYRHVGDEEEVVVPVDACTFDRVLLYLEHEAREEEFKFDPLIASDLLAAARALGIAGLQACCEKVLGSFKDRVRQKPIGLSEVIARNEAGGASSGQRTETLLLMSGMVLDISRWLFEHPGGSNIIPSQALNVDSTVFFEIYHASRQSFLYLKEFYIGELAEEDLPLVPLPPRDDAQVTEAFREHLARMTPWRIKPKAIDFEVHKSF